MLQLLLVLVVWGTPSVEECEDLTIPEATTNTNPALTLNLLRTQILAVELIIRTPSGGMRGPHHPRGHYHHQPRTDTKLTQDTELLRDVETPSGGMRGPHHPLGHYHHQPRTDTKLTQDTELLRDVETPSGGMRGPHHPRGHYHHQPGIDTKLTQDTELLRDVETPSGGMRGPHHPRGHYHHQARTDTKLTQDKGLFRDVETPSGGMRGHYHPLGHYHHQARTDTKLTQDKELFRDVEHIKEDLGDWGMSQEDVHKLTPEEMDFHYFKLHDFDNNTKLDGLEILQAIYHTVHKEKEAQASHDEEGSGGHSPDTHSSADDDLPYFIELIDQVLAEDDQDNDGYLSYIEYVIGRQREQSKQESAKRSIHNHG
ncbi:hypothetical protein J6590_044070 [Homalodisca vitripennis]|nr:hypothetical protein J6590_044070 [Homalodisca vitripennis]